MNFLKRLFSSTPANNDRFYPITVKCLRCGEVLSGQVNLNSELSPEYDDSGRSSSYFVRKVLMGRERCFQQVEVALTFDAGRRLVDRQITGGAFVEEG